MPLILPSNSISAGGYEVANSCVFDRASTDNMTKSMSDGSSIKGVFSGWVKVDGTSNEMNILSHFQDTNNVFSIATSGSGVYVIDYNSGYSLQLQTNRIMRDPSAWFHLYVAIDRSQATADNRNRMFINGVEETSFAFRTNYSQQTSGSHEDAISMNDGECTMYLGGLGNGNQMFGGHLAEIHWVDGSVPAVTEFGEFDEDTGIWKPKLVSGVSYGTNGFYLDFQDSSNLGNDANGGTDLTENNITSTNQSTDTPTNNFATINALDNYWAGATLEEGNTKVTTGASNEAMSTSTFAMTSGKWYMEVDNISGTGAKICGITPTVSFQTGSHGKSGDVTPHTVSYTQSGAVQEGNGSGGQTTLATYSSYTNGDIIGIYMDLDNMKAYLSKNGTLQSSTGIDLEPLASNGTGHYMFFVGDYNIGSRVCEANFGNGFQTLSSAVSDDNGYGAFEYSPNITGDGTAKSFYACCTKNLAEYG